MKSGMFRFVVAGMMLAGVCAVMAAEPATPATPATGAAGTAPAKGGKVLKGVLSAPAAGAAADVVAVLTVTVKDATKTYNLTCADAEVAAKIKAGVTKGAIVKVHGELGKGSTSFAVTTCEEAGKHPAKPAAAPAQ